MEPVVEVEPPGADGDEDGDDECVYVSVSIMAPDGTDRRASVHVSREVTDAELAEMIMCCVRGVAIQHGGALPAELAQHTQW